MTHRVPFGPGREIGWRREAFGNNEPPPDPMAKPKQPAARERWESRLKLIGVTLDSLVRQAAPLEDVYATFRVHMSTVARLTKIPETSLRAIAEAAFTEIKVPGHVVGWEANWFVLGLDDTHPHDEHGRIRRQ